jgi:hypothetical protein
MKIKVKKNEEEEQQQQLKPHHHEKKNADVPAGRNRKGDNSQKGKGKAEGRK